MSPKPDFQENLSNQSNTVKAILIIIALLFFALAYCLQNNSHFIEPDIEEEPPELVVEPNLIPLGLAPFG